MDGRLLVFPPHLSSVQNAMLPTGLELLFPIKITERPPGGASGNLDGSWRTQYVIDHGDQ